MTSPVFLLRLAKRDFKFSVAHFTLFSPTEAEPLHGHNYQVRVDLEGGRLDPSGLLVDAGPMKKRVRELCRQLDDRVLLPEKSPWIEVARSGDEVEVRFRERRYRFPASEVALLPLENISMELLARHFWRALAAHLGDVPVVALAVEIEETDGQSCRYRAELAAG